MNERPVLAPVTFGEAFLFWLKLGFISFGGPAGQISLMHQELVERRRWISEQRFLHALNYCMLLPGPEAQQLATYIGWLLHRTWGGMVAGGLFVLPSLLILIGLSWLYVTIGDTPLVAAMFSGIKPAIVAIVAFAAFRIGARVLRNAILVSIAVAAFLAIFALQMPFPLIVLAAGLLGYAGGRLAPAKFAGAANPHDSQNANGAALIDDDTPSPTHARFRRRRMFLILAVGSSAWIGALGTLAWMYGISGALTQMGLFFTKAALVTFGGAYAVLPYVFQGAVEHYGWLTPSQMIDGLALGETTPGPLIMVVAFVGFIGAWTDAAQIVANPLLAGILGGLTATFFTFLPSFIFIFLGAPLVEATRGDLRFSSTLTAITAAVVGVIVNLAVFFALHVFWPQGFGTQIEVGSLLIGLGAGIALFAFRAGVVSVVLAAGAAGILLEWSRAFHLLGSWIT